MGFAARYIELCSFAAKFCATVERTVKSFSFLARLRVERFTVARVVAKSIASPNRADYLGGLSAFDHQRVPYNECSRIRTQPKNRCGDFFGRTHPPDRFLRDDSLASFGSAAGKAVHHGRADDPGAHCIDADVLRGVIQSCRFSQADHSVFRRGVSRLTFEAFNSSAGRSIDDRAAACLSIKSLRTFPLGSSAFRAFWLDLAWHSVVHLGNRLQTD
jgi:hypothetical protein